MFKDMVKATRSFRTFDSSVSIGRDELCDMIDTARLTASAMNRQPLLYVPLEKENTKRILKYTRWAAVLDIKLPPEGGVPTAFVLMCTDFDKTPETPYLKVDAGIAAQTLLLAATEKGYGGCILASIDREGIKKELGLSERLEILLGIALGKPDEKIVLEEAINGECKYYRDENGHHVPKRPLADIVIDV